MTKRSLRLVLSVVTTACLLTVGPAFAGADPLGQSIPVRSPDNETAQAWFVELSGAPAAQGGGKEALKAERQAFYANAAALGLSVKQRQAFGTLWNGVSVSVPASQAGDLLSVPGVTAVYPVRPVQIPPDATTSGAPADLGSNPMIGVDAANGGVGSFNGQGVKVAVIDSGLDYTNPDLGGCSQIGPPCRTIGGWDFVGDSYDATPTDPTYQPIPHPGADPRPCDPLVADRNVTLGDRSSVAGHGTHVAGVVGAKAANAGGVTGVAPGVSFLAYRVFGCNGGTDNDNIVAALERAYQDGAQVVNMSIGDDYASWPEEPTAQVSDLLVSKGVVVVAAEGNAGGLGSGLFSGGDPAVGDGVIAVASFDNVKSFFNELEVDGVKYPYVQAAAAPTAPQSGSFPIAAVSPVNGCSTPAAGSLTGKIALIKRGTCPFYNKAANAQAAGAVGVVLYNNAPGFISPTVAPPPGSPAVTIPVVLVQQTDGNAIAAAIASGAPHDSLTWTAEGAYLPQATGGLISSFSSWGPTAELGLKPDLGAPGGLIRSTWPTTQFGGHNVISGTSMASPQVAGAAAILLQAGKAPSQVRDLLSNSAEPTVWNGNRALGLYESPLRQGAGLIKVDRSVAATAIVTPAKLSLGEGLGGVKVLTVTNSGGTPVTYNLSSGSAISPAPLGSTWPNSFGFDLGEETVTFSSPRVTAPAGGQATVTATISVDPKAPDGELYGGFIQLMPTAGGNAITVPYAGYKGDYQAQQVLTPTASGFPWLAKLTADGSSFNKQSAGSTYTLQGNDVPFVLYHLNIPARKLNVQVENADGGFVHTVFNYADKEAFLPRNASATGFFGFAWDGTRGQDNGNNRRKTVPNGQYMLELSILKPLGDEANPADWETFTTPVFTLSRP